ncbi:MAG: hypothetical protein JW735_05870 [Prolixibacteraceae bacterium]|jgi:hypothetical protein|nr:hypothetical protein [Prolixibacteraceae bacterium]
MKAKFNIMNVAAIAIFVLTCSNALGSDSILQKRFNFENDLLLVQYDCKTDVDDLHTIAAFATLMANKQFKDIDFHAVAGTYGIQDGLYVPPNELMQLAFGNNWTDAHNNIEGAVAKVKPMVIDVLKKNGDIWIAEAGQSDFSAALVKAVLNELPQINSKEQIHIVQHSDWNEKVTSPEALEYVKKNTHYQKIPDGNAVGNGSPGFRDPNFTQWSDFIENKHLREVWQLAIDLGNKYNGKEGRYNNEAITNGGLDFSDLSESCEILGLSNIVDTGHFFKLFGNQ